MNKFFSLIIILLSYSVPAQDQPVILENYPIGQEFYRGGTKQLFQDIKTIFTDHNLIGCDDHEQTYAASVLVRDNGSASFVKDFDSTNIMKNKCAYDLFRKVFPYLKGWTPAGVDGMSASAIAQVNFVPAILFKEMEKIYHPSELTAFPEFPGGVTAFHKEFSNYFSSKSVGSQESGLISIQVVFIVNELGGIEDITVTGDQQWDVAVEAVAALKKIKIPWKPAQVNGKAVKTRMGLPISMKFK